MLEQRRSSHSLPQVPCPQAWCLLRISTIRQTRRPGRLLISVPFLPQSLSSFPDARPLMRIVLHTGVTTLAWHLSTQLSWPLVLLLISTRQINADECEHPPGSTSDGSLSPVTCQGQTAQQLRRDPIPLPKVKNLENKLRSPVSIG